MAAIFGKTPSLTDIPVFITAGSPQGLRRKMFDTNLKLKAFVNYQFIQYVESEKKWYAWFVADESQTEEAGLDGAATKSEG